MADEQANDDPVPGTRPAHGAAEDVSTLNELILVAREGGEFYVNAAQKVASPRVRALFEELAAARARLVDDLGLHVRAAGAQEVKPTAFGARLRRTYVDLLARVADDTDREYVTQLEEVEDGLLGAFEDAVAETQAPEIRKVLEHHLPRVRASHDRIRAMKQALLQ
jgi:uncharacterized protein (TIGR02284 family)